MSNLKALTGPICFREKKKKKLNGVLENFLTNVSRVENF